MNELWDVPFLWEKSVEDLWVGLWDFSKVAWQSVQSHSSEYLACKSQEPLYLLNKKFNITTEFAFFWKINMRSIKLQDKTYRQKL